MSIFTFRKQVCNRIFTLVRNVFISKHRFIPVLQYSSATAQNFALWNRGITDFNKIFGFPFTTLRLFSTQIAFEPSTSDGLTVEGILGNRWTILDESESDWRSHAAAIAQSIHLIKKRLQVLNMISHVFIFQLISALRLFFFFSSFSLM